MHTENNIKSAIERSVSHTEPVTVVVTDIPAALAEVNAASEDYDHTEANEGEEVWGTVEGGAEFRLLLVVAEDDAEKTLAELASEPMEE